MFLCTSFHQKSCYFYKQLFTAVSKDLFDLSPILQKYRLFLSIKHTGAQNAPPPFLPKKSGGNSSSYLQNAGRFSKTFTAEILVQTAKYCLPQITYLLIHVFLINFRQGNVKLVLLKEVKPIILHVASENQLFCECRKFIGNV